MISKKARRLEAKKLKKLVVLELPVGVSWPQLAPMLDLRWRGNPINVYSLTDDMVLIDRKRFIEELEQHGHPMVELGDILQVAEPRKEGEGFGDRYRYLPTWLVKKLLDKCEVKKE